MYLFGPDQKDQALTTDGIYSWMCQKLSGPDFGIPFYSKRHYKLYVRSSCLPQVFMFFSVIYEEIFLLVKYQNYAYVWFHLLRSVNICQIAGN